MDTWYSIFQDVLMSAKTEEEKNDFKAIKTALDFILVIDSVDVVFQMKFVTVLNAHSLSPIAFCI